MTLAFRVFVVLLVSFVSVSVARADEGRYNSYLWPQIGPKSGSNWFEWWYSKVVDPKTGRSFFFVYGVVNPWDEVGVNPASTAYVSFGDFSQKLMVEAKANVRDFRASTERYQVAVGTPAFGAADASRIQAGIRAEDGRPVSWDLRFEEPWSFNAMGWAMGIPGLLSIGWYPAQASALASGTVRIGDETVVLERAPAYQDRNWGRKFPKWWTWIVANHFDGGEDAVLVAGGGAPRILGMPSPYEGVVAAFRYEGETYAFRPTDGVFPKADISFGKWEVKASRPTAGYSIEISAYAPPEAFMDLQFQSPEGKVFHDLETLNGSVRVRLKRRGKPPVELVSSLAGIEFGSY